MASTSGFTAAALAGVLLVGGTAGTAAAGTTTGRVVHDTFARTTDFVDTEVCAPEGFDVQVHEVEVVELTAPLDAQGVPRQFLLHVTYTATLSANGITLHEADRWNEMYYPDGSSQTVGQTVHVTGPGGLVQLDAGRIRFAPDGSVTQISGPHPQFEGQTWCSALTP